MLNQESLKALRQAAVFVTIFGIALALSGIFDGIGPVRFLAGKTPWLAPAIGIPLLIMSAVSVIAIISFFKWLIARQRADRLTSRRMEQGRHSLSKSD